MKIVSTIAAASCLISAVQAGMYGQPVINLDAKTFKQALGVEHAAMVAFVAPWCGHCKALGPEFTAAASSLSPLIPFYAVDCDEEQNKPLCGEYQIQGFPTIKAFPRALKGAARDYQGERKRGALVEFAKGLVPDKVKKLRIEEGKSADGIVKKFLEDKPTFPHALLIHPSAPSIPFLWKVLGHRFASKMNVGYIRDSPTHSVLSSLGIYDPEDTAKDPTRMVVWKAGAKQGEIVEYDGVMKFNGLLEFLQSQIDGTTPPSQQQQRQKPLKADSTPKVAEAGAASKETTTGESAAEKRARQQAKLDEAERRDRLRREKLNSQTVNSVKTEEGTVSEDEKASPASPADAPAPGPGESVEEEVLEGSSPASDIPIDPEPEQGEAVKIEEPEKTEPVLHEEL